MYELSIYQESVRIIDLYRTTDHCTNTKNKNLGGNSPIEAPNVQPFVDFWVIYVKKLWNFREAVFMDRLYRMNAQKYKLLASDVTLRATISG